MSDLSDKILTAAEIAFVLGWVLMWIL